MTVRFDDSLPMAASVIRDQFGEDILARAVFVRDATGKLSVVLDEVIEEPRIERSEAVLRAALGTYARSDRLLADKSGFGVARLLDEAKGALYVSVNGDRVRVIERRIVGVDWLRPPSPVAGSVPRVVFGSLKGGVGRSTALCVMAAHLSRRGLRVLCVDFDLEAPGIGSMLLRSNELPEFGTLDYFVESGLSPIDAGFLNSLVGDSYLGRGGARVGVVPAIGARTAKHAGNAISKLSRAYLEEIREDGSTLTLTDRLRQLVDLLESTSTFDVLLLDARAGLHESTAAAIQGLGADILLFGTDQPQTFLGYSLLMRHLAQFPVDQRDDWRERLRFVHAKAPDVEAMQIKADERFTDLYRMLGTQETEAAGDEQNLTAEDFTFDWESDDGAANDVVGEQFTAPPILRILDDANYRDFDPVDRGSLLEHTSYLATFGSLIEYSDEIAESILSSKAT
ncbi:KGGVGR-motif variant AAA ATPase [Paraburkholderia sp. GAS348]|uniref:KGGVGR-motif variant AAA ATPase n=1 Tax=Paraburkholderia sp. GAS348 TaxID=3035132 RepID=UPI003D1FCF93